MKQVIQIVVIRKIKHSDSHSILRAYSRQLGTVAFAVREGKTAEAGRRRALSMPLTVLECVAVKRQGSELMSMSEPRAIFQSIGIRLHPAKNAIALFMAETLGVVLHDSPPDVLLFDFLCRAVELLDTLPAHRVANFHICFLIHLAAMLGIAPDFGDYTRGRVFDLIDGRFRSSAPLHGQFLSTADSAAAALLGRITFANMHLYKYTRAQRNEVLDHILRYYEMHYTAMRTLKSPEVLRQC